MVDPVRIGERSVGVLLDREVCAQGFDGKKNKARTRTILLQIMMIGIIVGSGQYRER